MFPENEGEDSHGEGKGGEAGVWKGKGRQRLKGVWKGEGRQGRGRERMKSKKEKGTEKGKEDREGKGKV